MELAWECGVRLGIAAHKEFRFILPALPAVLAAAGSALAGLSRRRRYLAGAGILLTQVPAAVYLSVWHQSGSVALMPHIAAAAAAGSIHGRPCQILLSPCHASYAAIHLGKRGFKNSSSTWQILLATSQDVI